MSSKVVISVIVVVVILAVVGYMGRHQIKSMLGMGPAPTTDQTVNTVAPTAQASPADAMVAMSPSDASSAAGTLTVSGSEFMFAPVTLTAKAGMPVSITFKNTGQYPHNFTIKELNVASKTIKPGESDTVTFTPKAGTYTYYCSVDSHESKGMKGTLTVQ